MTGVIVEPMATTHAQTDPRRRMIQSAALLFRRQGIEGTSFSDVLEHSGAPRGSIYHHFPEGKAQLAEEAILRSAEFTDGCPIVAAAVEGDRTPGARAAAGVAFTQWEALIATALERRDVSPDRARSISSLVIAAIEGGIVMARAQRSTAPLERVASEIEGVITGALSAGGPR